MLKRCSSRSLSKIDQALNESGDDMLWIVLARVLRPYPNVHSYVRDVAWYVSQAEWLEISKRRTRTGKCRMS